MRLLSTAGLAFVLALAAAVPLARAADSPFTGTWSAKAYENGMEIHFAILKIEGKGAKPEVSIISTLPPFKDAKIEGIKADAKSLKFSLKGERNALEVTAYAPKDAKSQFRRGSLNVGPQSLLLVLEPTEEKEVGANPVKPAEGFKDLQAARGKGVEALEEVAKKLADKPAELFALQALLEAQAKEGTKIERIKGTADKILALAADYGPAVEGNTLVGVARMLNQGKDSALALDYARKAAASVTEDTPPDRALPLLKVLATSLKKADKTEELKALEGRIAKIDEKLDQEFAKNAVPFEPKAFEGRKGKSDRVVVVELFTGAQCPPCVSADVAFDAALKAYKPSDVVLLQYHLHIPGPDPLTNSDSEARQNYYGEVIQGTPTVLINGKETKPLGGFKQHGKERFGTLSEAINEAVEKGPGAKIQLKVDRESDKIDVSADVTDLKKTGDKLRLRFALLEDVVRYPGRNGQRLHHHVIRAFPGGVDGFALKDKSAKETVKIDLGALAKELGEYLDKAGKRRPFMDDERPLDLKHLKVVAFVQDDDNKEILQAVQADVPEAKE